MDPIPGEPSAQGADVKARERLLRAAVELFARKGYAATSVNEIVAGAGVTKPILYYYFDSKEGIYIEILNDAYGSLDRLLDQAVAWEGNAIEKIRRIVVESFDLFLEKIDAARVVYMVYYGAPQGAPPYDYDRYRDRHMEVLLGFVEEGIQRGELKTGNSLDMAMVVTGLLSVGMEMKLCQSGPKMDTSDLLRTLELVFDGIANKEVERR
jgi:TetR/AcrR family transcriptional regulator